MKDSEVEILKYELQELYKQLWKLIKRMPEQYHDLKEFKK